MPTALLASYYFTPLERVFFVMMFINVFVAPLMLLLLIYALIRRNGMYGTLRACGWINLILVGPYLVTSKYDVFFTVQAVIWATVLVLLALPDVRPRVFGESFDPLGRDVGQ